MTDVSSDEDEFITFHSLVGEWAQKTERLLMDKLITSKGKITLTRVEAKRMVVSLGELAALAAELEELDASEVAT
jgi:hypothetical protein